MTKVTLVKTFIFCKHTSNISQLEERFYINIPANVPVRVWQRMTNDGALWGWKYTTTPITYGLIMFLLTNDEVWRILVK